LRTRLPGVRVYVVGSKLPREISALVCNDVVALGYVKDLKQALGRFRVMAVPLRYGAGIKGKIGTSLAHGLPCVSTSVGAEGMGLEPGTEILMADTPAAFVEAVHDLYTSETRWNAQSQAGLEYVQRTYSHEAGRLLVKSLLDGLGATKHTRTTACMFGFPWRGERALLQWHLPAAAEDPFMFRISCTSAEALAGALGSEKYLECMALDDRLAERVVSATLQVLPGFCRVCQQPCNFHFAANADAGAAHIDWKQSLVCGRCGLNNSQRLALSGILGLLGGANGAQRRTVYLDCRDPLLTASAKSLLPEIDWQTSRPWDGHGVRGGYTDGERHEDPQALTFTDGSFDLVVCNGSLAQGGSPEAALSELRRVMKAGARLLVTATGTGAEADSWNLPDLILRTGLRDVGSILYWSRLYGHLGPGQVFYHAEK